MKCLLKILICLLGGTLFYSSPAVSAERIRVVTTLPFLQDFAEAVGGQRIQAKSLMTGLESEHTYTPKPSDILAVQEAAVLIKVGLGLETWVEPLIHNANNPGIRVINTSEGVPLLENVPPGGPHPPPDSRHAHGGGNPHIWLDPENAKPMLRHILEGFSHVDPAGRQVYLGNFSVYVAKLNRLQARGRERIRELSDTRIITHHPAWPYFARRFGLTIEGNLINQVGTEPSAKDLARLTLKIKREGIRVIVSEPQLNQSLPRMLAQETGAKVAVLTPLPGAVKGAEDYLSMIEYNIDQLVKALSDPP